MLQDLAREAWEHYFDMVEDSECIEIIVKTMPILYFGNYNAYMDSRKKIITAALNPSCSEFPRGNEGEFLRFPKSSCLKTDQRKELSDEQIEKYLESLDEYFINEDSKGKKTYFDWFCNKGEKLLNHMGTSYFQNESIFPYTAIHTDIKTPIATDPTWGQIKNYYNSKKTACIKKKFSKGGQSLWLKLVERLQPDIILLSAGGLHKSGKLSPLTFVDSNTLKLLEVREFITFPRPRRSNLVEIHKCKFVNTEQIVNIIYETGVDGFFQNVHDIGEKPRLAQKIYNELIEED